VEVGISCCIKIFVRLAKNNLGELGKGGIGWGNMVILKI
jgi:hypothetical protein